MARCVKCHDKPKEHNNRGLQSQVRYYTFPILLRLLIVSVNVIRIPCGCALVPINLWPSRCVVGWRRQAQTGGSGSEYRAISWRGRWPPIAQASAHLEGQFAAPRGPAPNSHWQRKPQDSGWIGVCEQTFPMTKDLYETQFIWRWSICSWKILLTKHKISIWISRIGLSTPPQEYRTQQADKLECKHHRISTKQIFNSMETRKRHQ